MEEAIPKDGASEDSGIMGVILRVQDFRGLTCGFERILAEPAARVKYNSRSSASCTERTPSDTRRLADLPGYGLLKPGTPGYPE